MRGFYLLSVWLHILAAAIWIGGMAFLVLVLVPVTRMAEYRTVAARLVQDTGVRFRWVGWGCLALLLSSGAINLGYRGFGWAHVRNGTIFQGPFGRVLGVKLLLVTLILLFSALHDFFIGPKATILAQSAPHTSSAIRARWQASWLGRVNLLLGLIVVALGILLVRGWIW